MIKKRNTTLYNNYSPYIDRLTILESYLDGYFKVANGFQIGKQ